MAKFKPNSSKVLEDDGFKRVTLDSKHNAVLSRLHEEERKLPRLKGKLHSLRSKLSDPSCLDQKGLIIEKMKELKKRITAIKKARQNYHLQHSQLLFNYYESKASATSRKNQNSTALESFFNIQKKTGPQHSVSQSDSARYLASLDDSFLDLDAYCVPTNQCGCCGGELVPIDHEGVMVCKDCSATEQFLIENDKPSYKDPPLEVSFYAYKRINHFREILAQFQAKETTHIPPSVINSIVSQMKKERISLSDLSNRRAKEILKKLGYNKYYEHIPFIKNKLGIQPPVMSPELEETLCNLFLQLQAPYSKFCPQERVNFLNYYYTVYKLCELLDEKQFLPFFPMLKDREKRIEQDDIWKKICRELNWEFVPTV